MLIQRHYSIQLQKHFSATEAFFSMNILKQKHFQSESRLFTVSFPYMKYQRCLSIVGGVLKPPIEAL